ncbi:MAG: 16S rRNA (adenine(1518)-N(6)/adenine(1519)-N(6))-dimethyltransferase RsmA [Hydrogenoanaerobacterium sp.]
MSNLCNTQNIKEILKRHGFTFSKSLGQNFIINPEICPRIAAEGGVTEDIGVIEIGAGIGVLTKELARRAKKVVVIELDKRLLPVLGETLNEFNNIKIINDDVLKVDFKALIAEEFAGMKVVVCANLPYYITSPVLMLLLEERLPIESVTVMVQKEAAERICAVEGSRETGAISFAVRYYSRPMVLFEVSRDSFLPSPNVDSTVIRLDIRDDKALSPKDESKLFRLIRGSFTQRRKTLANSLSSSMGIEKGLVLAALAAAGVSATARPEALTLKQFCDIANQFK